MNPSTIRAGWRILLGALVALAASSTVIAESRLAPPDDAGRYLYLVDFAEPGLLERRPAHERGRALDLRSDALTWASERLQAEQTDYRSAVAAVLGRQPDITHHYLVTHSGMAMWLYPEEVQAISDLPGVKRIERNREYDLSTFRGPWFIGADQLWDGSATPDGVGVRGEGMTVAVLDTGIDPNHPSFADAAACSHGQGETPAKVLSFLDCATTNASGMCSGPAPSDPIGHGSHVSGTAVGNLLDASASPAPNIPAPYTELSGVAPCAHLRSYRVCPSNSCDGAQIVAGMNSILLHGDVDVMNFSISGGQSPWTDHNRNMLDLVDAGVLVVTAAGNTGPGLTNPVGAVNHKGPWLLSVASVTHDGVGGGLLSVSGPGQPPTLQHITASRGSDAPAADVIIDLPIRHFGGQPVHAEGCNAAEDGAPPDLDPFPAGYFDGAAALIHRGICPFTVKINNAFTAGAELVIIRNNDPEPFGMNTAGQQPVPAYVIPQAQGQALQAYINDNPETTTVSFQPIEGDVLSEFSLRGPTPAPLRNLTKPDIAAPGDFVLAAVPGGYGSAGGTSMASPHVAGGAALLRQIHPDWSIAEINSALALTAHPEGLKEDMLSPWDWDDVGSGRANLARAARAGLVMHETTANYLAANPGTGGDVRWLNTPSLRDMDCTPDCTWTRTIRNTLDVPTQWSASAQLDGFHVSVSPSDFSFSGDPSETRTLTITAIPGGNFASAPRFGDIVLTEAGEQAPSKRITLVASGVGTPTFAMSLQPQQAGVCIPDSGTVPLSIAAAIDAVGGYSGSVTLAAGGEPAGVGSQVLPAGVTVPDTAEWLLDVDATAGSGDYVLSLAGDDGSQQRSADLALALDHALTQAAALVSPVDGAADLGLQPPFAWTPPAGTRVSQLQVATDAAFGNIVLSRNVTGSTHIPTFELEIGTQYFWRVGVVNHCGDGDWSQAFSFTTRLQPEAVVEPANSQLALPSGNATSFTLDITNAGTGNLVWAIVHGRGAPGARGDDPWGLDETLYLPDFTLNPSIHGGGPINFNLPAGVFNRGVVTGFTFAGTASGLSGGNSRASDTCMRLQSPGGQIAAAGGSNATMPGCGDNPWEFHGPDSGDDGEYQSTHATAFQPPVADAGTWAFTLLNDWTGSTASAIHWSDTSVTLHKTPWPFCDHPGDVPWLDVSGDGGSTPAEQTDSVEVSVNSTGLISGRYFAALCLTTNDPDRLLIVVPVILDVDGGPGDRLFRDRFEP